MRHRDFEKQSMTTRMAVCCWEGGRSVKVYSNVGPGVLWSLKIEVAQDLGSWTDRLGAHVLISLGHFLVNVSCNNPNEFMEDWFCMICTGE